MLLHPVIRPWPRAARPLPPGLAFCLGLALCFGLVGAGRAATLTVTSTADSGAGSLRAALATSRTDGDGDVITFDPSVFAARQTISVTGDILFAYAGVTIQGPAAGVVLDGSHLPAGNTQPGLVFESDTATSFVSSLTFQNFGGSGLSNRFGTVTVTNCTMQGNTAEIGGGVFNDGAMTLIGCTIAGNTTSQGGAGIFTYGTLTLTGCTISGNVSGNYGGGGIYNGNGGVHLTLTDCTLVGNVSGSDGGGAISNVAGILTATNCTFTGNQATTNDDVYGGGGAIAIIRGTTTLTNDIFSGDTAPGGGGAEIFFNQGDASNTLTISHCDIATASIYGPGHGPGGMAAYTDGGGNISADPLFVNAAAGDFHLQPHSPCIAAGTSAGAPANDKDGNARPTPPSIGAYDALELVALTVPSPVPGGTVVNATVTLSAITASDVVVGTGSSDPSVVRINRGVIVHASSQSATFAINTFRSHVTKTVTVTATLGQVVQTQNLTITGR